MIPKASIILPCYNVEKYIARSIETVLAQTFTDFELLVIIDGSPDSSKQIAEKYAQKDNRIKVYEKPNGGLSDARNYGLERATGEYIYFMDSDDWIEPDLLADNLKIIEEEMLDLVIFGYIQDDENQAGDVINSKAVVPENKTFRKSDGSLTVDEHLLGLLGYAWNKIYRKSFLDKHNLRFEKGTSLVEDILFNTQVYIKTDRLRTIDKAYYHYLNRPVATLIKAFHADSFELNKRKIDKLNLFFTDWGVKEKESILSFSLIGGVRYCINNLYAFQNQLTDKEKIQYIKTMLNDTNTRALIRHYPTRGVKDLLFKYLIQYKQAFLIAKMAKITK